jgi:hypothetical protein
MKFGRFRERLDVVQMSVAEVVLADRTLDQWYGEFFDRALRRRSLRTEDGRRNGHRSTEVHGRRWAWLDPLRVFGRGRLTRGAAWRCAQTNHLLACHYDGSPARRADFDVVADSLLCHETDSTH